MGWDTTPLLLGPSTMGGIGTQQGGVGKGLEEQKMEDVGGHGTALQTQQGGQLQRGGLGQLPVLRCRGQFAHCLHRATVSSPFFPCSLLSLSSVCAVNVEDADKLYKVRTTNSQASREPVTRARESFSLRADRALTPAHRCLSLSCQVTAEVPGFDKEVSRRAKQHCSCGSRAACVSTRLSSRDLLCLRASLTSAESQSEHLG